MIIVMVLIVVDRAGTQREIFEDKGLIHKKATIICL